MLDEITEMDLSLKQETRGHACLRKRTNMTIYLSTIEPSLLGSEWSPFENIEDLIEELVIHEVLHTILDEIEDRTIDSWHRILCHLDNTNVKETKDCRCPIDCFWRDIACAPRPDEPVQDPGELERR